MYKKDSCKKNKKYFVRSLWIFEKENFAAHAIFALSAEFADFFLIGLIIIYLIGRNVLLFENPK